VGERIAPNGWDYIERIEVTDRAAYEQELAEKGKDTTSIWSQLVEP